MQATARARDPRWHAALAAVLVCVPIAAAAYSFPHDSGRYTQLAIAHRAETVLVSSLLCLAGYRNVVTKDGIERCFLTVVVFLPSFSETTTDYSTQLGKSAIDLVLADRMVMADCLALIACVLFVARSSSRTVHAT